jgi:hypothetical protein
VKISKRHLGIIKKGCEVEYLFKTELNGSVHFENLTNGWNIYNGNQVYDQRVVTHSLTITIVNKVTQTKVGKSCHWHKILLIGPIRKLKRK